MNSNGCRLSFITSAPGKEKNHQDICCLVTLLVTFPATALMLKFDKFDISISPLHSSSFSSSSFLQDLKLKTKKKGKLLEKQRG